MGGTGTAEEVRGVRYAISPARRDTTMKKALRISLAIALVASVLVGGLAGTAMADTEQEAEAEVEQEQDVEQTNVNVQDDNTAISAAVGWNGGDAESGDAYAVQYSDQTNNNAQVGIANAENEAEQNRWY
ncbi:hypothetical protein ACFFQF_06400 [Haladaptatus pallidirubidus]|uniref:Uncharacterized protein n=1 Tax=Haladaptatus pallidirubidus TaxID=1008152 RepID=A0AAV3UMT6_9EURY|nr:hypothetical protein [Haladaptatus pallidirubidus]